MSGLPMDHQDVSGQFMWRGVMIIKIVPASYETLYNPMKHYII